MKLTIRDHPHTLTALIWYKVWKRNISKPMAIHELELEGIIETSTGTVLSNFCYCPYCAHINFPARLNSCFWCPGRDLWEQGAFLPNIGALCERYVDSPWRVFLRTSYKSHRKGAAKEIFWYAFDRSESEM